MQDLETVIFDRLDFNIPVYFRYVDDTFLLIPKDKVLDTLTKFNSYHNRLQFTYEIENNNCLNFLNVLVIRNSDNSISINWFRKNTFSGRFLNYFSSNPLHQKIGIIKNLVDSAISLSDTKFHQENLKLASKCLILNGYPSHFINKHIRRRFREIHATTSNHDFVLKNSLYVSSTTSNSIVSIPYYGSLSEVVRRLLQKYHTKIILE